MRQISHVAFSSGTKVVQLAIHEQIDVVLPDSLRNASAAKIEKHAFLLAVGETKDNSVVRILEDIFDLLQDPSHWKCGFVALDITDTSGMPLDQWIVAAMKWYHAGIPEYYPSAYEGEGGWVGTSGYQAD